MIPGSSVTPDFILEISFDQDRQDLDDLVRGGLYLSRSSGDYSQERDGIVTIFAFFDDREERDQSRELFSRIEGVTLSTAARAREDWLQRYEQSLAPIEVGARFLIVPDSSLLTPGERLPIIIPQERAFGTGSHASTALCLEMLESLPLQGKRCLDIGTGSGILAIGMAKLGAKPVIAFDNDLDTLGVVRVNLQRNDVAFHTVMHFIGDLESARGRFDVVVMNIQPEVIVPLLPEVKARMNRQSVLILSGILTERRGEVIAAAGGWELDLKVERTEGEWWCGEFEMAAR